jgi:EVE domain
MLAPCCPRCWYGSQLLRRPCASYDPDVPATWIVQSNPKLYDIDAALTERPVIYWRVPQFFEQMAEGDRVLIWRAGKQAGVIGTGVLLSDPKHYDLSGDDDPFAKSGFPREDDDWYVPVRVWPAEHVPKVEVSGVLPEHRIVTAPMGTVFRVGTDELTSLQPLLELQRSVGSSGG